MTFPSLPDPPNTSTPDTFQAKADAFFAAIPQWSADLASYGNAVSLGFTASSSNTLAVPAAGATVSIACDTGKGYAPGMRVMVCSASDPANVWFFATVISYTSASGALSVKADFAVGSGSYAGWRIVLSQPYVSAIGASGTSTTSLAVPAIGASVTLTASAMRTWQVGDTLQVASTVYMVTVRFVGTVTAYNSATGSLTLAVVYANGNGAAASWAISPGVVQWGVDGTSTTSLTVPTIGTSVTLTTSALRTWKVGDTLQVVSTASPSTTRFVGTVTAYNSATGSLTLTCKWARGSGTVANWVITPAVNDTLLNMWTAIDSGTTVALDLSSANHFVRTVNGAVTFSFINAPTGQAFGFSLRVIHTTGAITWPASVLWPEAIVPILTTGKTHLFSFFTDDGGACWRGSVLANYGG